MSDGRLEKYSGKRHLQESIEFVPASVVEVLKKFISRRLQVGFNETAIMHILQNDLI